MKNVSFLFLSTVLLVSVGLFSSTGSRSVVVDAELVEVTQDNMLDVLNSGKKSVFIMYAESWCKLPGFSEDINCKFASTWRKFAEKYPSSGDIVIAEGDADEHSIQAMFGDEVMGKQLTFFIYHPSLYGERSGPYPGEIKLKALKKWYREEVAAFKLKHAARGGQKGVASAGSASQDEADL